jgi:hypothetical protein
MTNFGMFHKKFIGFLFFLFLAVGHPVFAQTARLSVTVSTPSMATATSVQMVAAKQDRFTLMIQNNSAANICCSLTGATLTGIIPGPSNLCFTIPAGGNYTSPPNGVTTDAVTCRQESGGTITTVYVHQG